MKKFITYWTLSVAAALLLPSLVSALVAMSAVGSGGFVDGTAELIGFLAFCAVMLSILSVGFFPAIVVLLIGVVWIHVVAPNLKK